MTKEKRDILDTEAAVPAGKTRAAKPGAAKTEKHRPGKMGEPFQAKTSLVKMRPC